MCHIGCSKALGFEQSQISLSVKILIARTFFLDGLGFVLFQNEFCHELSLIDKFYEIVITWIWWSYIACLCA